MERYKKHGFLRSKRTRLGPLASRNALRGRPAQLTIMPQPLSPMPKALSFAMSDYDLKILTTQYEGHPGLWRMAVGGGAQVLGRKSDSGIYTCFHKEPYGDSTGFALWTVLSVGLTLFDSVLCHVLDLSLQLDASQSTERQDTWKGIVHQCGNKPLFADLEPSSQGE